MPVHESLVLHMDRLHGHAQMFLKTAYNHPFLSIGPAFSCCKGCLLAVFFIMIVIKSKEIVVTGQKPHCELSLLGLHLGH